MQIVGFLMRRLAAAQVLLCPEENFIRHFGKTKHNYNVKIKGTCLYCKISFCPVSKKLFQSKPKKKRHEKTGSLTYLTLTTTSSTADTAGWKTLRASKALISFSMVAMIIKLQSIF